MIHNIRIILFIITAVLTLSAEAQAKALFLQDQVLSSNTTWSGEIIIEGVVVVGRPATLTIQPGTIVKFIKVDRNKDGIGDSEIRVLGQLLANGTPLKPIIFKSAEKKPAPMDWSYVLIFTSGKKNQISYCQFSDAFTGFQVHFSTALVSDCLFTNNREGIRFGRAKLDIQHNLFTKNTIGIRFTRMEGPVEIKYNDVYDNKTGVFLVPSGQNIVNFFEPGKTGKPWNEGHLEIFSNNIFNNSNYNLKLGAKQMWDLKVTHNWWNSTEPSQAKQSIFDIEHDHTLGRAIIEPMAKQKVRGAGPRHTRKTPMTSGNTRP